MDVEPPASAGQPLAWSVSALLLAAGDVLVARFGAVVVRGELSGFSRAASGHCYFALKDGGGLPALLRCAMFRRAAGLLDFDPRDGAMVEVRGRIGLYEPRGELQVVVESMQRLGAGTLYEEFLRLRARLEAAGLFDAARKRPLPRRPSCVAVVTSPGAAALHDVLTSFARRAPQLRVVIVPSLVQGAEAPPQLAAAIERAGRDAGADCVLLVRGGGSLEDLWAFNDERVVRAIVACTRPVVSGVGHESDVTLADLAADLRAATPTAAAELAIADRAELLSELSQREQSLQQATQRHLQRCAQRLDAAGLRLGPVAAVLAAQVGRLRSLGQRLQQAMTTQWPRRHEALDAAAARWTLALRHRLQQVAVAQQAREDRLRALDPHHVLARGYVWVEDESRRAVVSVSAVRTGQTVRAVWSDGAATARIESVQPSPRGGLQG